MTGVGQVFVNGRNKHTVYNVPASYDIETTSIKVAGQMVGIMYVWQLGINGLVMMGRTWAEWEDVITTIVEELELSPENTLPIYIHNEAYEFQWIRFRHSWHEVFALDALKPVRAVTTDGLEYRCSYKESNLSLAKLGETLTKYPVAKMVGDLDYSLPRHSGTPLTEKEIGYCVNDVKVVMAHIAEQIEACGNVAKIPMTSTGYVREDCRKACYNVQGDDGHRTAESKKKYSDYRNLMKSLTIDEDEYKALKRAFQGGFTHASAFSSGKVFTDVDSFDFSSSYPAVMVAEKYPMSKAEIIERRSLAEYEREMQLYCCIFDVEFTDIELKFEAPDAPISSSRCWDVQGATYDNGRIRAAKSLKTTITDVDYSIIKKFYNIKSVRFGTFRRYLRGYLPTPLVDRILHYYEGKTTLKGVAGREEEYMRLKAWINAIYGMMVTDPLRDIVKYDGEWSSAHPEISDALEKYNNNSKRFQFFPWGVYVTAYARRNLFSGIWAAGYDYHYADTDSIKISNAANHMDYIEKYNRNIAAKLEAACKYHGFDIARTCPVTIKGVEKPLGAWDHDGHYDRFKTLGAKRYLVEKGGKCEMTVAGCAKKSAIAWMEQQPIDVFDQFDDGLTIPASHSGRKTHHYIDYEVGGVITDYLGNTAEFHELSSIYLESAPYTMTIGADYLGFLASILGR